MGAYRSCGLLSSIDGRWHTPIKIEKPKKAFSSSTVMGVHDRYFSSPIACLAYRLLWRTISSCRSSEKKSSKTSIGCWGMGVVGPTGEVKSLMVTGCSWSVHEVGSDPVHYVNSNVIFLGMSECVCVCVCVRAYTCVCTCMCVRVCVHACMQVYRCVVVVLCTC